MCLSEMIPGQSGIVTIISPHSKIRRRLQDLGIVPGTHVVCVNNSPLGGPKAYAVRRTVIALRKEDAAEIIVRETGNA